MSDISKVVLNGEEIDIKDGTARDLLDTLAGGTLEGATVGSATQPVYLSNGVLTVAPDDINTGYGADVAIDSSYSTAFGAAANAIGWASTAVGYNAVASDSDATVVGANACANTGNTTAIGWTASATGDSSTALGAGATANVQYATAIGRLANAVADSATAVGWKANAIGVISTAIGMASQATGYGATGLGRGATASANYATALGVSSSCANTNGMQLGNSGLSSLTCKVSLTTTSDIRDKADVVELDDGATDFLRAVKAIRYVYNGRVLYLPDEEDQTEEDKENLAKYGICAYDTDAWEAGTKKGSRIRVGFSAQEVREALESVYGDASYINLVNDNLYDFDQDSIPDGIESQLAMNYEGFIPVIVKALQEIDARVTALEDAT